MGVLPVVDVLGTRERQFGTSRPVGAVELIHQTTLTQLEPDSAAPGGLIYGGELAVDYCNRVHRLAETDVAITRLEFKPKAKDPNFQPGTMLFVSEMPYRSMWVAWAPFRRSRKDAVPGLADVTTKTELLDLIAKFRQDIFESRTGQLTAAIEETQFGAYFEPSNKLSHDKLQHVFGCYTAPDGADTSRDHVAEQVFNTEYVKKQVRLFKTGLPIGPEKSVHVPDSIKNEVESIFWLSIMQALAGPGDKMAAYQGKPVAYFARDLCEQHLLRASRKDLVVRRDVRLGYASLDTDEEARRRMNRYLGAQSGC